MRWFTLTNRSAPWRYDSAPGPLPFYTMPFVEGRSLRERLAEDGLGPTNLSP